MRLVQTFADTRPLAPNAQWGPEIAASAAGFTILGGVGGLGVAELVAKPLLYPGEAAALNEAGGALRTAQNQFWADTQKLPSAIAGLGEHDPAVTQLEQRLDTEKQTVATLQSRADQLPNHDQQVAAGGLSVGVSVGLLACGIKLGVQKMRTGRKRNKTASAAK
jgi:hypothetical protein